MYGTKNANQYEGDCIIEVDNVTYIGRLEPGYSRTSNDLPVKDQPVWQIERITTEEQIPNTNNESEQEEEVNPIYITRRQYPNGREAYEYVMSNYANYNYDYRH